jgi:hypothetical protein
MRDRYNNLLENLHLDVNLNKYDGLLTLMEAKRQIPQIKEIVLGEYEKEILKRMDDSFTVTLTPKT